MTERREEGEEEKEEEFCAKTAEIPNKPSSDKKWLTSLRSVNNHLHLFQIFGTETEANVALLKQAAEQRTDEILLFGLQMKAAAHFHH